MSFPGQASGGYTESSSALRILYAGHRNTFAATLTDDAFTQDNPPVISASSAKSTRLDAAPKRGVLSGSVAFTRPDAGGGKIGGPNGTSSPSNGAVRPLGLYVNDAQGNEYENSPAEASGKGPYVSSQGTMGTRLYETQVIDDTPNTGSTGDDLTYELGDQLFASQNGYITNAKKNSGNSPDNQNDLLLVEHGIISNTDNATMMGIVKITPDSSDPEIVMDLRV